MVRADKAAAVTEVRERLESATATVLTEYRGLTVAELASLRAELRKNDAEYKVVKNTLTRIAVRDAGFEVPSELLTGPTAVTFCAGDPVPVAKVLRKFSRDNPELVVKGSILDGKLLDAGDTLKLADLASREELLSRLAGLFTATVAQPARLAQANLTKAVRLFAALQERKPADTASAVTETAASPSDTPTPEGSAPEAAAETEPAPSEA